VTSSKPAFTDILCAVDGSQPAREAARQAAILAGGTASLTFACVGHSGGTIDGQGGDEALADAVVLARENGARAKSILIDEPNVANAVLDLARHHQLLVVGSRGHSRRKGIAVGSIASIVAHEARVSVLAARQPPGRYAFPRNIVLASDGSAGSRPAAEITGALARAYDSRVLLFTAANDLSTQQRQELAEQAVLLQEASGVETTAQTSSGGANKQIVQIASQEEASLVVIGSRGLTGMRSLGSVSERVFHDAPCSVLIDRTRHQNTVGKS
jgi:nucleotide-binding universal stress UspA family protein